MRKVTTGYTLGWARGAFDRRFFHSEQRPDQLERPIATSIMRTRAGAAEWLKDVRSTVVDVNDARRALKIIRLYRKVRT